MQSLRSNVQGIGTDIIEIERIKEAILRQGDRFLDRLFTKQEKEYCLRYKNSESHFAGRFAAKEAILKALGTGLKEMTWSDIEILNDIQGKPEVHLSDKLQKIFPTAQIFLSISHCDLYATATAVVIGE
jgi:holo-[acyl-carrier protein] synthase